MSASVVFGSLLIALVYLRCVASDKAELERLRKAYEARVAAQTEDVIYSFEFNKSAEIRATRKPYYDKADYTYEEMDQFTNVPASFEPKVSEPYNRYQLWRIFNWYDKDKNNLTDNPYAKKYNKVIDRVKWFYRNLVHKVEAQGRVHEDTRYDRIWNRSRFIKHELHKVERLKQRLLWYGTPRTTSELSILHRYLLQQTDPGDKGAYTESVSPWFKIHPPYTIPDGRPMYFTWFDGSPEQRIPYANPDWVHFDPRSEGLDSGPVNWTARSMDPLPWHERKILGGYTNKYLWPPRTTPTDFWRPSRKTTVEVVEGSEYIYVYNEDNPRTTQDKGLDSSMRDRMDSAGYEWWKSEEAKVKRKRFEEERAELLAENNLTDSHSPEKRVLAALRAEVDPSRIKEGMHSAADREIQKFARHFVGCFAPTRRIWFNEELTLRPRFVANSSRRTLNMFDELYPTVVRSDEINLHYYITTASPTTHLSLETLYDGLDTSEEEVEPTRATPTTDETGSARSPKAEATSKADRLPPRSKASKAVDALLGKLTTLVRARGKAKKLEDAEKGERKDDEKNRRGRSKKSEAVAGKLKAKSPSKESKAAAQSKQAVKRSRRHVARRGVDTVDPEQLDAAQDMPGVNDLGQRSEDLDSEEIVKERMDEEDKRIFAAVEARMACKFGNNGSVRAREVVRQDVTPMKKRKPTYHYTSKDVEEAERHWNEVQKKKAEKAGGGKGKKNKRRQRSAGQYEAELDPLNQKFAKDGRTIITMENSTPSYEYFQKKVYPSQNLTSAQLNDEDFVRNLIPKLEEENKMLMQELRMRATEQAMEVKAAQKDMIRDMSEVHDDKSFEMGLQSIETTAAMTTVKRKRRATSEELDALDLKRIDEYGALDVKRRKKRFMNQEESEELDASDLKRIDAINAKLKAEGYDREAILKELNATKNKDGELEVKRRKKRFMNQEESEELDASDLKRIDLINAKLKAEGYDREAILKELNATKNKDGELEVKRRKKRFMNQEESEELDASDLKRIDLINAKLKAEGYDREAILKELNATKNKDGELEVKRKKRSIDTKKHDIREDEILNAQINRESLRQKREVNETGGDKQAKLKRNLEVYSLIDQWKEQQVELAMCSSKERRLLNEIDKLRKEMNISHGEDDPYYKAAVTEAIRRENETALKYAKEINAWWSKEQKERRAWEAELIKKHNMPNQRDNEKFDEDEEKIKQEQLKLLQQVHEKEMAERKAKGLPPDSYEKMLPVAKKEMEEEQKKYEEECRCRPKTVDELMKEFDGSVDIDKLRRNLEVYDLIDKWKKRQEKIEAEKEKKEKQRKRRAVIETGDKLTRVKRKTGKDSDGEYVEDMSRYNEGKRIYKEIHHKMKGYTDQADDSKPVDDVVKGFMDNQKKYDHADYRKKRDLRFVAEKVAESSKDDNVQLVYGTIVQGMKKHKRKRRDIVAKNKALKRYKRRSGKRHPDREYIDDKSDPNDGKKVYNEFRYKLKGYKGDPADGKNLGETLQNICIDNEQMNKEHKVQAAEAEYKKLRYTLKGEIVHRKTYDRGAYFRKKRDLNSVMKRNEGKFNFLLYANQRKKREILTKLDMLKNRIRRHEYSENGKLDDRLKLFGPVAILRKSKVGNKQTLQRKKRDVNEKDEDKQAKLKRNLEVYSLIDQWKEQQVELAMCSSKERRLLNEIDKLRKEMNISHGEDDPYYKAAVTEAIRRENETALKYAKEINAWWSKEQKERRAWEAELIKKHNMPNQRDNEKFDEDEEKIKQEQLKLLQQVHEKEMAERKAKGLPPDSYEKMLPVAKKEMEEEQKKYEEECRCRPKTVDELMKEFDGSVDIDKLRRNLEVYDLIDKWKKRQEKIEAEKEKEKQRKRRAVIETGDKLTRVKRKTGKDSDGEYVEDMSRYNEGKRIYKEIHHKMKGYTDQADDSKPVDDVVKGFMDNQKKYDHADYRKKRDLRCHEDKKVNHKANVDYFQVEDFNIKRHGNTSIYEYVYSDTKETEPKQEKTWHEKCENVAERLGIYGLKVEENHKESKNAISPDKINKYHENIEQRKLKKVMLRKRRDADALNISNIDIDHKVLSSELNRMISEHAEKQKLYPRTTKKRPTASSEYPLKDDFQPFIKSSKELRDFEEKEQMRERFALFKTFNDLMETTKADSGDYLDVFKTTTTTKSAKEKSKDKIQNLRSFIKTKLDDTVKKFSEALILLNATGTTVAATTEHSAQPTTFRKIYEHNPDDLLHATDVTFDFAANAGVQTTTQEVETFSPWYTHVQVYNKYNFSEAADGETTVVVFPPSRPEDFTCSPLYHFHRYYHELNTSVDLRTVEETTYAFMTKDATDSFTLPSYAPIETVYKYPNQFDENATELHEVTTSLFENSDFKDSEEGKTETVIVTPLLDTKELANMALTDDDPEVNKDISDIRKFHPPNLNEIKQYIDSVTRSREKFCRDNFEWDSENSAYTMVREEATKTVCPKLHQKDREFIEALEKEGLRPSTKGKDQEFIEGQENEGLGLSTKCTLQTIKITRDEEKNIYDRYNLEEPYKMSKYDSVSQPEISPDGSIPDLKTYVKALLKKYSNEATNEALDSAQRRKKHLLKQKLKDLLATAKDSKEPGKSIASNSKDKHKKAEQREIDLKTQLLNVLHKYSEEILKTNVITNNRTKKKYRNMKNVVRLVVENYSPGPETDIVRPQLSLEETSQEEADERKKATGPTDEPHVDLKRQLDQILSHSHALNPHDKTLKLMVQKALRVSCENIDSDNISFEPVFNKTRIEDLPDYVTNDAVTDRQFKTHFRLKLKNLMNQFSREVLGGKENLTSQERRVNGHMLQVLRAAVNAFTFGPETDNLAHVFKKIPDDSTEPTRAKPKFDEKKDLRVQVEKFIQTYKETGHEDTFEKDTDKRLKTMVADLMEDNSFEYSHTAEMEGRVKRLTRAETIADTTHTTTLNSEEQAEVEEERRRRTPTFDYYDTNEEVAKYRPPGDKRLTTIDYWDLYKKKVTEQTSTTLSESQQARRDRYVNQVERMGDILDAQVASHERKVLRQSPTTKRTRGTTRDSMETDETSEEEPITYRTQGPVERRMEYEFSDSREFEIPFYGVTVTKFTARLEDGFYTPGQGFENRSTLAQSDEYARAHRKFRYELANPAFNDPAVPRRLVPLDMLTPPTSTVDYYSFYRERLRKITTSPPEPTRDPVSLERYRQTFIAHVEANDRALWAHLDNAAPTPADAQRTRKVRRRLTTPDSELTEEESEMEPITYFTAGPVDRRVEYEASDSREYYVPILGITLSSRHTRLYTPGEGFENRSTIPPDDEYRRAHWQFKYDPQVEIDRQGLTFSPQPSSTQSSPPTTPPRRPLHKILSRVKEWRLSDKFDALKQRVNEWRLGDKVDSLKRKVNNGSLWNWRGKIENIASAVDKRAHRLMHALYAGAGPKHNCSVEH